MTLEPDPDLPPRIQFRSPQPYDRRELDDLWSDRAGYGLDNALDAVFDDEAPVFGLLAIDVEEIVGFGIVMLAAPEDVSAYFPVDTDDYPTGEVNGLLHAGGVTEEWEGRGLGTELMRLRVEYVRETHDADAAFGNAWLRPHAVDSSAVFESLDFTRLDTVADFFQRSEGERDCPDCPSTCTCSGAIYGKELD